MISVFIQLWKHAVSTYNDRFIAKQNCTKNLFKLLTWDIVLSSLAATEAWYTACNNDHENHWNATNNQKQFQIDLAVSSRKPGSTVTTNLSVAAYDALTILVTQVAFGCRCCKYKGCKMYRWCVNVWYYWFRNAYFLFFLECNLPEHTLPCRESGPDRSWYWSLHLHS